MGGAFCVAMCMVIIVYGSLMQGECRLPGINLDQHDFVLPCAFVHAVGGVGGFALPWMCLSYRTATRPCIWLLKMAMLIL